MREKEKQRDKHEGKGTRKGKKRKKQEGARKAIKYAYPRAVKIFF